MGQTDSSRFDIVKLKSQGIVLKRGTSDEVLHSADIQTQISINEESWKLESESLTSSVQPRIWPARWRSLLQVGASIEEVLI
jgi:hypothetical protein